MPMDYEQSARPHIEQMIADWDSAFVQGNTHGIRGHLAPQDRREEENFRQWAVGFDWTEDRVSESAIRQFEMDGFRAFVVIEQNRRICYRRPLPTYAPLGRLLLNLFSKFVVIERQVIRTEWAKSSEGWLCHSELTLRYRTQLRLRKPMTKPAYPAT